MSAIAEVATGRAKEYRDELQQCIENDDVEAAVRTIWENGDRRYPEEEGNPSCVDSICGAPGPQCAPVIVDAMNKWPSHETLAYVSCWALAHIIFSFDEFDDSAPPQLNGRSAIPLARRGLAAVLQRPPPTGNERRPSGSAAAPVDTRALGALLRALCYANDDAEVVPCTHTVHTL